MRDKNSDHLRCTQKQRRVFCVCLGVEGGVIVHDSADIVLLSVSVKRCRGREGHVSPVEDVLVVQNRVEEPNEEHETTENVGGRPPRRRHWVSDTGNNSPVKGEQAHAHALNEECQLGLSEPTEKTHMLVTEQHVDLLVVGSNPRDPVKVGKEAGEIVGEPRPNEAPGSRITEESLSRHASALVLTETFVLDGMQGVEKRSVDQGRRPDHGRRPDQHFSVETT